MPVRGSKRKSVNAAAASAASVEVGMKDDKRRKMEEPLPEKVRKNNVNISNIYFIHSHDLFYLQEILV